MRVLSYNIRGIGSSAKGRIIRNLLSIEKIDFACFQETKIGLIDASFCQRLWGNEECEYLYSPAINRGGGLLCIWRKGNFVVEESNCNPRWIYLKGKWGGSGETYAFINVYAPCSSEEKRQLWGELVNCRRRSAADCWCVLGYFNSVRDPNERKGITNDTSVSRRDTEFFNDFIHSMELVDVPMTGRRFTWFRPNGSAMSRLDRCLISLEWLALWPHSVQHILDRDISDHCPVVLKHLNQEWGPKPFRVLNCWHSDIRFRKFVEES
ncbi:uncharacterized protein LOC130744534 [Lotus japonicus]|uniref:uncharacterized protein LOC130744534 n=1 Tax=Lotus japonicus TaxID=34305 RepID=UPI0025843C38|nr:uncharacterized protein LOC130744534 [Lotus japonicus]